MIFALWARPIAWWPKQIPRIENLSLSFFMISIEIPEFSGLPDPGDMIIWSGLSLIIVLMEISSFLNTLILELISPIYWTRL